jgi:hypothetical protein
MAPPIVKVSNYGTQYVEFRRNVIVGSERCLDSENGEPLQVNWIRRIGSRIYAFISKWMVFFNQK